LVSQWERVCLDNFDSKEKVHGSTGHDVLFQGLAIHALDERICTDAQSLDPESIERFCQVWAEVGRAILLRRKQ